MAFINSCRCPWVCIGDFNFTTNDKEILGGNRSGESSAINYLKEFIFEFSAIDLGFAGNSYTWARGRWGSSAIKRKLDRGIASISWCLAFPSAAVAHLGVFKSNHTPILLDTNPEDSFAHSDLKLPGSRIVDATPLWRRLGICKLEVQPILNSSKSRLTLGMHSESGIKKCLGTAKQELIFLWIRSLKSKEIHLRSIMAK